jgi:N-acetylneuraminic acid mutarotase
LPDPVGFGGMFAGELDGRLVTGGGSQFRDKPLWLQGEKGFSDRVFVLSNLADGWTESSFKLPFKAAHFASAAAHGAIYLAGGLDASGTLRAAWEVRASGDRFACTRLPDLPASVAYAAAAIVNGRLYVAGGQPQLTARVATSQVWSLDLRDKDHWRREPDVPGPGVFLAAAAGDGDRFYLLGGVNFGAEGKSIQSAQALCLNTATGQWERLPDLPEPRVGAATPCVVTAQHQIFLVGGYARSFPGAPREHPGFSPQTYLYDLSSRRWSDGPKLPQAEVGDRDRPGDPGPLPMIAAPAAVWRDHLVVISGEVRASTRTPAVVAWPLSSAPAP